MTTGSSGGVAAACRCILAVVLAAATVTLTTQPQPAAAYGRQASTPTAQFVQSICNTTVVDRVHVASCYDILVEGRESYKGSHVRVVGAAVTHMVKDLAASADELRKFKATPAGAQYNVAPCVAVGEEALRDAGGEAPTVLPAVAKLRSLEAAGDDKIAQPDLDALAKWVDKIVAGVKRACVRETIYVNPNSEAIDDDKIPTLKLLDIDVSVCRDLVTNYNKFTSPPHKAQ